MPDPRGPYRKVLATTSQPDVHRSWLACGHVRQSVRHQAAPKPGEQLRCPRCGPKAHLYR